MTEILLEKKLTTDFTMGFELEAIWYGNDSGDDTAQFFNSHLPGGDLHDDGSLGADDYDDTPFEWSSPVLPVNTASFEKIIKLFDDGLGEYFYINSSCGFHHHITFPGITAEEMVWIMCKLALDDNMRRKLESFKGIRFVTHWSSSDYLNSLKDAVLEDDYKKIIELCDTGKYSLVNVHPQGTLEWRGPRGFLNRDNLDEPREARFVLVSFYKRLWQFVKWITDVLDENEINDISKENFIDGIRSAMKSDKKSKIKGFTKGEEVEKGLMKEETLKKVCNEIASNPKLFLKYIKSMALEQIIQKLYNTNRLGKRVVEFNNYEEVSPEIKKRLNNLCYKYIPYRMLKMYSDTIESASIYDTSKITMNRLFATAKFDGATVTLDSIVELIDSRAEEFNPTSLSPSKAPLLYNGEKEYKLFERNNLFKLMVKENYLSALSDKQIEFEIKNFEFTEDKEIKLNILIKVLKNVGRNDTLKLISNKLFTLFNDNPIKVIEYVPLNRKQLIYAISYVKLHYNQDYIDKMHNILVSTGKISEELWNEIDSYTRRDKNSIDDDNELPYDDDVNARVENN